MQADKFTHGTGSNGATAREYVGAAKPDGASNDALTHSLEATGKLQRMHALCGRIEEFLLQQMDRFERVLQRCHESSAQHNSLQERIAAFESERQRWQLDREQEIQYIQQAGARLAEAWERIEAEQRRILANSHSGTPSPSVPGTTAQAPGISNNLAPVSAPLQTVSQTYMGAEQDKALPAPTPPSGSDLLQFQQLRREIQKHSRRSR
jgi:DNA repair exonuclease SbcCD ATPase subunit